MLYKKIYLSDLSKTIAGKDSYFEIYLNDKNNELHIEPRLPMIVVPGGGYEMVSQREGEPIALRYASEGFNCFVLHYTCKTKYPLPHYELSLLVDYIKKNAEELNVKKNCISLVGFSAGGHLVASYSLLYKELEKDLGFKEYYLKPSFILLCYPVTSLILNTNSNTRKYIVGDDLSLVNKLTVPENVTENYPPTFIFTTKNDNCVPAEHSYLLADALKLKKVPCKLVVFEKGDHGGSLFNHNVFDDDFPFDYFKENRTWVEESVNFIFDSIKNNIENFENAFIDLQ